MTHPGEGTLQALLDGELRFDERAEVELHMAECGVCAAEMMALRESSALLSAALPMVDLPAPATEQARWRVEGRRRRKGAGSAGIALRRAAVLIVGSAAVLSATVPGSPVRQWLAERWDGGAVTEHPATVREAVPAAATDETAAPATPAGVSVRPAEGRMRVVLVDPADGVRLRVQLHDGDAVGVWTSGEGPAAHFRTAPDRIEVEGVRAGEVRVEIPRSGQHITLEVNGRVYLWKDGKQLRFSGPATDAVGPEILFEVGS
jgi:hypothetical protein